MLTEFYYYEMEWRDQQALQEAHLKEKKHLHDSLLLLKVQTGFFISSVNSFNNIPLSFLLWM